jgi:hypothetical protein
MSLAKSVKNFWWRQIAKSICRGGLVLDALGIDETTFFKK